MEIKSYAKINLGLDVIRKREDNYHELKMIMAGIELVPGIYDCNLGLIHHLFFHAHGEEERVAVVNRLFRKTLGTHGKFLPSSLDFIGQSLCAG